MKNRNRNIAVGVVAVLLIGGGIAVLVWFLTRPENIDIVSASSDATTSPSLVKFAVDADSVLTVRIDETRFVANNSLAAYLLTVEGLPENMPGADDDLMMHLAETTNFTRFSSLGSVVSVVYDENLEFPYQLPQAFDPESIGSFVVTDGSTDSATGELALTKTLQFNDNPTNTDNAQSEGCVNKLPVLSADMNGRSSYNVGGTISIEYREDLVDGKIVNKPVLRLENIEVPRAPGPFLYLSKRPVSPNTWDGDEDIFIPIDGANDGSFTKEGTFTQELDEIMDVSKLQEYADGAFIVWCRPFSVWMGGGQISVASEVSVSGCTADMESDTEP